MGPTPDNMNSIIDNTELSSHEGTRSEFNPGTAVIKLGIDVHQEFYVVVVQEGGAIPSRRDVERLVDIDSELAHARAGIKLSAGCLE